MKFFEEKVGRKKSIPKEPMKHVRLELDHESHRLLRIIAAHKSETMSDIAKAVVLSHIQSEAKRLGIQGD